MVQGAKGHLLGKFSRHSHVLVKTVLVVGLVHMDSCNGYPSCQIIRQCFILLHKNILEVVVSEPKLPSPLREKLTLAWGEKEVLVTSNRFF